MDKSFNDKQLSIEIEFGFSYIHEFGLDEDTFETLRFGGFFLVLLRGIIFPIQKYFPTIF